MTDDVKEEEPVRSELPFVVVECSSEDIGYESSKLCAFEEDGDGWQSKQDDASDVQTLVLQVRHQHNNERIIHSMEILCHEYKIAERVEITLGESTGDGDIPNSFDECTNICKLGYITLACNEQSEFSAREMKSVPIQRRADFIKLVLRGIHKNPLNADNQVGLVGIRVFGKAVLEDNEVEDNAVADRTPTRSDSHMNTIGSTSVLAKKKKSEISATPSSAILPPHIKQELDTKLQSGVDRLERLKKEAALNEDFEMAGKIKSALGNVYSLLIAFKDAESNMKQAAAEEDYSLASKFKTERDLKRDQATRALHDVEQQFVGRIDDIIVADISSISIKDGSFMSSAKKRSPKKSSFLETSSIASRSDNSVESNEESRFGSNASSSLREHPLLGVDNAEELPAPEDIGNAASPDIVHRVEDLFGSYRAKCFFSKNWQLREAALAKMTLLAPDVFNTNGGDCAEVVLCSIVEMGIEDKNVQVYLASLILLDEAILQLESVELPQSKVTPLVSRIVTSLLTKLADSKPKVVDAAELTLLCLANSPIVDTTALINAACKRVRSKESKGGRTVKSRLRFLENMALEFGKEVSWKRVIEFAKLHKAFEHKDGGVRDAAKALVLTLVVIFGESDVLESLKDCEQVAERQLNEFRSARLNVMQ